jgi:hypothetical protein
MSTFRGSEGDLREEDRNKLRSDAAEEQCATGLQTDTNKYYYIRSRIP